MKKYLILLFLALLPAVVPAQDSLEAEQPATSYTLETVPNVYRLDRRLHVSDPTGILSAEARSAIDHIFTQLEDSTGIQTAVYRGDVTAFSIRLAGRRYVDRPLFGRKRINVGAYEAALLADVYLCCHTKLFL